MKQQIKVQSPGRINLIGEHTDYNDGFVLPAAVDKNTVASLRRNGTAAHVNITALNVGETFSFDLNGFAPVAGGWPNYVMGVVRELQQQGAVLEGFDGRFEGNVPIGSGMSSSAALECSFAFALNELFDLGLDPWQLIKASQMAEHNFVGIKCGIMDQFASVMGRKDHAMLLDCRSLEFQYYPLALGDYRILLLNTNVSHTLASSEYNTRRAECEEGVQLLKGRYPAIASLRDVQPAQLYDSESLLPERIYRRCRHVVTENQRVKEAVEALSASDFQRLGQLLYQSHASLQQDYEVSCPELDFLVQQARNTPHVLGGRMMGGGFGGCTINILERSWIPGFIDATAEAYRKQFGRDLTPYEVTVENGTTVID